MEENYLTPAQLTKFKEWQKKFNITYIGATGGHFGLRIIFTSIGAVVFGTAWNGEQINLTEDL